MLPGHGVTSKVGHTCLLILQEAIQRGVNINLSTIFQLAKGAFYRYNALHLVPEEGWFGRPKYYIDSWLKKFASYNNEQIRSLDEVVSCRRGTETQKFGFK